MRPYISRWNTSTIVTVWSIVASYVSPNTSVVASASADLSTYLEKRLGLTDAQVQDALGALLLFVHGRISLEDFDRLAAAIPNAGRIMLAVQQRGTVDGPLDDIEDYEAALADVGIGQPRASEIAPAVIRFFSNSGRDLQREIMKRALR